MLQLYSGRHKGRCASAGARGGGDNEMCRLLGGSILFFRGDGARKPRTVSSLARYCHWGFHYIVVRWLPQYGVAQRVRRPKSGPSRSSVFVFSALCRRTLSFLASPPQGTCQPPLSRKNVVFFRTQQVQATPPMHVSCRAGASEAVPRAGANGQAHRRLGAEDPRYGGIEQGQRGSATFFGTAVPVSYPPHPLFPCSETVVAKRRPTAVLVQATRAARADAPLCAVAL